MTGLVKKQQPMFLGEVGNNYLTEAVYR